MGKYYDMKKRIFNMDKAYKVALKSKDLDKIFVVEMLRRESRKMSFDEADEKNKLISDIFKTDVDLYNL